MGSQSETRRAFIDGIALPIDRLEPGLYCVATPIGNLQDITIRALKTLAAADVILCEDTRMTARLTEHYGITTPRMAYHEHNEASRVPAILKRLSEGQSVALVSDAGTPLISDPGFPLVSAAADAGVPVFTIPGPSAVVAALSVAGIGTDAFYFLGFLPTKEKAKAEALQAVAALPATLVCYEAPTRLLNTLQTALHELGDRQAVVARELTKRFEEIARGSLSALLEDFSARPKVKGEIVLLIERSVETKENREDLDGALRSALQAMSLKDAADMVSTALQLPRRDVYKRALALRDPND
ncbi:MAG: 16S rRNA (cytidine(1402)-2'-O)-methyltransferase [Pseudomonadota bacterium]